MSNDDLPAGDDPTGNAPTGNDPGVGVTGTATLAGTRRRSRMAPPVTERTASDALATYRYLRIGLLVVAVMIGVSVLLERAEVECWQTSISAYYYTPVRAVFTGALLVVGFGLIIIKGSTLWEDIFLNVAGMLAPIVALAPTTDAGTCWSIAPLAAPKQDGVVADWVVANIDNNIRTALLVGVIGLVLGAVIATAVNGRLTAIFEVGNRDLRIGLTTTLALIIVVYALYLWWDEFNVRAHGFAAVGMFGFLMLAAFTAARDRNRRGRLGYATLYASIGALMIVSFLVPAVLQSNWRHWVLVAEVLEIILFAVYWAVQTQEHWHERVTATHAEAR
jgi:hypothetical protein